MQAGAKKPAFSSLLYKWATFLLSLRDYVEQGQGQPFPDDVKIEASGMWAVFQKL